MKKYLLLTMLFMAVGGSLLAKNNISLSKTQTAKLDSIPGAVTSIDPFGAYTTTGPIIAGLDIPVGVAIPYEGGNGGSIAGQIYTSINQPGLELFIDPQTLANGNGELVGLITGVAATSGTALFQINIGGQSYYLVFVVD